MWELIFILIEYFFLLYVTFHYSKRILVAPSFSFVLCFIPQMILLLLYADEWSVDLSDGTFLILVFGPILFWLGTIAVNWFYSVLEKNHQIQYVQSNEKVFETNKITSNSTLLMIAFLVFQITVLFLTVFFLVKNISGPSLASIIMTYRRAALLGDTGLVFPGLLLNARTLCLAIDFYYIYFFANAIINKEKKNRVLFYLIFLTGSINYLLSGARTGVFQFIIALVLQLYFAYLKKNKMQFKVKIKNFFKFIIVCVFGFQLFMVSADLLGRDVTTKFSASDYLSIYLAAEVKNLDLFVKEGKFEADISNNQTFRNIINRIALYVPNSHYLPDTSNWNHLLDIPFREVNGYNLGNVYTVYYAPLYDFGYMGVVVYVLFMGIFCEFLYLKAKKELIKGRGVVSLIIYSYVYFTIVFSFFSPKFSEMIFDTAFIKMVLVWKFMCWYNQLYANKKLKVRI